MASDGHKMFYSKDLGPATTQPNLPRRIDKLPTLFFRPVWDPRGLYCREEYRLAIEEQNEIIDKSVPC